MKYDIEVSKTYTHTITVEADDVDHAKSIGAEWMDDLPLDFTTLVDSTWCVTETHPDADITYGPTQKHLK